jgi:hypothetical protein
MMRFCPKLILLAVANLFLGLSVFGQHGAVMNLLPELQQSGFYSNPAYRPAYKTAFSMPVLGHLNIGAYNTGLQLNRMVAENPDYSTEDALNDLNTLNHIGSTFNVSHAMTGFKVGNAWLRAGVHENVYLQLDYPRELVKLALEDWDAYNFDKGPISIIGTGVQFLHYRSYDFGLSLPFMEERLNIGINARYINGLGAIWTKNSALGLSVDTVAASAGFFGVLEMYTSGALTFLEEDLDWVPATSYFFNKQNHGGAVDLGVDFKMNDHIRISGALNNVGWIGWKNRNSNFIIDTLNVKVALPDINDLQDNESVQNEFFVSFLDTLDFAMTDVKTTEKFNMPLPANANLAIHLIFNEKHSLHVQMIRQRFFNEIYSHAGAAYRWRATKWFTFLGSATIWNMQDPNFGLGMVFKPGPVQLSFMFDNLFGLISPDAQRNASTAFGLNFVF